MCHMTIWFGLLSVVITPTRHEQMTSKCINSIFVELDNKQRYIRIGVYVIPVHTQVAHTDADV